MGLNRQDGHLASASITTKKGKLLAKPTLDKKAFPSFGTSKMHFGNPRTIASRTYQPNPTPKVNATHVKKLPKNHAS